MAQPNKINPLLNKYPGGVDRGTEGYPPGYDLWTPRKGFQVELVGDQDDGPTEQYTIIRSPLYGDHLIPLHLPLGKLGNFGGIFNQAVRSDLFARGLDISQLTKLENSATIPNTQDFFRAQTTELVLLYSLVIQRNEHLGLTEDDLYEQVMNQMYEDLLHYLLSHGLEINFDGWNSTQESSTKMGGLVVSAAMPELLENGQLKSLNQNTGEFTLNKKLDYISSKKEGYKNAPGLDFDKWHYTMTEIAAWFADYEDPEIHRLILEASNPEAADIDGEGNLYFKDPEVALFFSKCYLLLTTEHWNEIMQRIQIFAGNQAFNLAVLKRKLKTMYDTDGRPIDSNETANPVSYAYGIDSDLDDALSDMVCDGDRYANVLKELLNTVGMQERQRFIRNKRPTYADFLKDPYASDYPNATGLISSGNGHDFSFGLSSPSVDVRPVDETHKSFHEAKAKGVLPIFNNGTTEFILTTLKVRSIDPMVKDNNGNIIRLSDLYSARYRKLLDAHRKIHTQPMNVELMLSQAYMDTMKNGYLQTEAGMKNLMHRPPLSVDGMRRTIGGAASRAVGIAEGRGSLIVR